MTCGSRTTCAFPRSDVVVLFVDKLSDLEKRVADIAARMHPAGGFWVAWPKRARRATDVTEDMVRRVALAAGMVDNKACSIGNSWLGIRLVLRTEIRDAVAYRAAPPVPTLSRRTRRPTAPAKIVHRSSGAGSAMHRVRALDEVSRHARDRPQLGFRMALSYCPQHDSTLVGRGAAGGQRLGSEDDDRPPTLEYVTEAILAPTCGQAECHSQFSDQVGDEFDTVASARRTMTLYSMVTYQVTPSDSYLIHDADDRRGLGARSGHPAEPQLRAHAVRRPDPDYDLNLIKKFDRLGYAWRYRPGRRAVCARTNDDSTQGCNVLNQLVECPDGTQGALITDCTKVGSGEVCAEGACVPE